MNPTVATCPSFTFTVPRASFDINQRAMKASPTRAKNLAGWIGFRLPLGEQKWQPLPGWLRPTGFDGRDGRWRGPWSTALDGRGGHTPTEVVWATVSGYPTRHTLRRAEAASTNPQVAPGMDQNAWTSTEESSSLQGGEDVNPRGGLRPLRATADTNTLHPTRS